MANGLILNLKKFFNSGGLSKLVYASSLVICLLTLGAYVKISSSNNLLNRTTNAVADTKFYVLKFYFDPALVPDMNFAKQVLPKYVQDMNFILAKNTNNQFAFDPQTGIILAPTKPQTDGYQGIAPAEGYDVWAYATKSASTCCGYMGIDQSGAAVLAGLKWSQLYNPDTIAANSQDMQQYWTQITVMLHEYAHVHNAGIGEYYSMLFVTDNTGVTPLQNISYNDPNDSFWSKRTQYFTDPLLFTYNLSLVGTNQSTRQNLKNMTIYSPLTAALISGGYRWASSESPHPTVDLQNLKVKVVDKDTNSPLSNTNVKIWNVSSINPYPANLLVDGTTDAQGEITFSWGGVGDPHGNNSLLHLIKTYKPGYTPTAQYVSIYDTDEARIIRNETTYTASVQMTSTSTSPTPTPTKTPTPTPSPTSLPLSNLLLNPGFEIGKPDNWTSDSHVSRSSTVFHGGKFSIKHADTKGASYDIEQSINNVLPNTGYTFSGFVNVPPTSNTFTFQLRIVWGGANGTIRTDTVKKYTKPTNGWDLATGSFVSPPGTTKAKIRMQVNDLKATVYADDFQFSK